MDIPNAHLWNGLEDPYLYRAVARLVKSGEVVDQVEDHFGVRVFEVDPKKGFFLNGRSYPLRGEMCIRDRCLCVQQALCAQRAGTAAAGPGHLVQ